MTAPQDAPGPLCCGEPMVHNSFTGEFECSAAYFTLLDEGLLSATPEAAALPEADWSPEQLTDKDVPAEFLQTLRHWRASRQPDRREPRGRCDGG